MSTKLKIHNVKPRQRFLAGRLVLFIFLAVGMVGWPTTSAQAAGIITHTEIVKRAYNKLDKAAYPELATLINSYRGTVNYGSMFPDWGMAVDKRYKLGGRQQGDNTDYNNLSEDAHDTNPVMNWDRNKPDNTSYAPFRSKLAAALLPTFRRSTRTEDDKKAIAFLFGVIAHQEADGLWHINDRNQRGYGKRWGESADPLIEVYADDHVYDSSNTIDWSFLPSQEIITAYRKDIESDKNKVSDTMLSTGRDTQRMQYSAQGGYSYAPPCYLLFLLPGWVGLAISITECALYVSSIPFSIEDYVPGGLQDGARQTARVWQQAWEWLSTYTPYTEVNLSSQPPNGANVEEFWYTQPVNITLSGTDMVNGQINPKLDDIALIDTAPFETFYSINGGPAIKYTQPLNFDSDGIYQISYHSVDSFGNSGSVENLTIKVDMDPPISTPTQSPVANIYGWNNSDVTITWNWADDESGIDLANCTNSSTSNGEGTRTLTASCKDKVGNTVRASHIVLVDHNCMNYHAVKNWEKTNVIAHTYNLKWKEIAKANKFGIVENLNDGDHLCIPIPKSAAAAARLAMLAKGFTPTYNSGWISFPLTTLPSGLWKITVRDTNITSGGWTEVDKIDTSAEHGPKYSFQLPSSLSSTPRVNVCLRNQKTNDVICRNVFTGT